jgi:hypothetical protein
VKVAEVESPGYAELETRKVLANSSVPGKEQRRFRRYSVNFSCEIKPGRHSGRRISTHTQDVSCGGLFFTVPGQWQVGAPVEFILRLPLRAAGRRTVALRCQGKVARVVQQEDEQCGIGATIERFEFVHLDTRSASQTGRDGKRSSSAKRDSGRLGSKPGSLKAVFPDFSRL